MNGLMCTHNVISISYSIRKINLEDLALIALVVSMLLNTLYEVKGSNFGGQFVDGETIR